MLLFLFGEDKYRAREKLRELAEAYKKKNPQALDPVRLDADDHDIGQITQALGASSFFGGSQFIILQNILSQGKKDLQEEILEFLKDKRCNTDNVVVFFELGDVDKRKALYKYLQKTKDVKSQEFTALTGAKLKKWASDKIVERKIKIQASALELLLVKTGADTHKLYNEIEKLCAYTKESGEITQDAIEELVKAHVELDIFKFIDALAQNRRTQAVALLHDHLSEGENPLYLLTMIIYQFRNLLVIKDLQERGVPAGQIAKESGLHPFVVKKSLAALNTFSLTQLKAIYKKLIDTDTALKSGQAEPELALDLITVSLTR
ncbi:DNA polymerase III subunit delta [Patescibacteria group bacterium]